MCVKDNLFIKAHVGVNKGDAQLDLILTSKEVLLTEMNILLTADTDSDEEVTKRMKPGSSWWCTVGGPETMGIS